MGGAVLFVPCLQHSSFFRALLFSRSSLLQETLNKCYWSMFPWQYTFSFWELVVMHLTMWKAQFAFSGPLGVVMWAPLEGALGLVEGRGCHGGQLASGAFLYHQWIWTWLQVIFLCCHLLFLYGNKIEWNYGLRSYRKNDQVLSILCNHNRLFPIFK